MTKRKTNNYLSNKNLMAEIHKSREQDQMTDELANMLQLLAKRYGSKSNFAGYCVDGQTQCMTRFGWRSYNEIEIGTEILVSDIHTNQMAWAPIRDLYINDSYDGEMIKLENSHINMMVTPGHKLLIRDKGLVPVEDIEATDTLEVIGHGVEHGDWDIPAPLRAFVAWVVRNHESVDEKEAVFKFISGEEDMESLKSACSQLNLAHSVVENRQGHKHLVVDGGEYEKLMSEYFDMDDMFLTMDVVNKASLSSRKLLAVAISDQYSVDNYYKIISNHQAQIERIIHMLTISSLRCVLYSLEHSYMLKFRSQNAYDGTPVNDIDINGSKLRDAPVAVTWTTKNHDGVAWCPTTEYGTFMARREGYICLTGNSYNEDMQAHAMMSLAKSWRSFDPEKYQNPFAFFTQCIKNSFIYYLNHETKHRDIRDALIVENGQDPSFTYQEKQRARDVDDD